MPVVFADEDASPGLKKGGVLNVVRHELEVVCDAAEIPSEITVSVKGLDLGESLHISAVTLPKGVASARKAFFIMVEIVNNLLFYTCQLILHIHLA